MQKAEEQAHGDMVAGEQKACKQALLAEAEQRFIDCADDHKAKLQSDVYNNGPGSPRNAPSRLMP